MDPVTLFKEHHAALYRYLVRYSGDPDAAADAAQEAFVRLLERSPRPGEERAWLFKVATNVIRESRRNESRRHRLLEHSPGRAPAGDAPESADAAVEARERLEAVQRLLGRLDERERMLLLMREEGFSHAEIAEAIGTTTKSVGTLLVRALRKLSSQLMLQREAWQ
ncbi:RNA polymerase sigma factor [soil metagenome]